jgi:hypothetical protein
VRAVAASTPEARAGYSTPEPGDVAPVVPAEAVLARGGRAIEA